MKFLVIQAVSGGGKTLGVQSGMVTLGTISFPKNAKIKVEPLEAVQVDKSTADTLGDVFQKVKTMEQAEQQGQG